MREVHFCHSYMYMMNFDALTEATTEGEAGEDTARPVPRVGRVRSDAGTSLAGNCSGKADSTASPGCGRSAGSVAGKAADAPTMARRRCPVGKPGFEASGSGATRRLGRFSPPVAHDSASAGSRATPEIGRIHDRSRSVHHAARAVTRDRSLHRSLL